MTKEKTTATKATATKATAKKTATKKTENKALKVVKGSEKKEKPAIAPSKSEVIPINKPTLKEITASENKEYMQEFALCDKEFSKAYKDVENSALKVAQLLFYMESNRLYEVDGYKSTADYAGQNFGINKSTVSRYINIVERFGRELEDKKYRFNGMRCIKEEYKKFSWSKLAIMAGIEDKALLDKCKPDMSYRDILTLIKSDAKQQKLISDKESFDAETETETATAEVTTKEIPTLSTQLIYEIKTEKALDTFIEKMKDKDFLDSIKQDIKDGKIIHVDRIVVTTDKKVSVK